MSLPLCSGLTPCFPPSRKMALHATYWILLGWHIRELAVRRLILTSCSVLFKLGLYDAEVISELQELEVDWSDDEGGIEAESDDER